MDHDLSKAEKDLLEHCKVLWSNVAQICEKYSSSSKNLHLVVQRVKAKHEEKQKELVVLKKTLEDNAAVVKHLKYMTEPFDDLKLDKAKAWSESINAFQTFRDLKVLKEELEASSFQADIKTLYSTSSELENLYCFLQTL